MRRAVCPIGAAVLLACTAAAQQGAPATPHAPRTMAAARDAAMRALAFVWAQQDADGGIRSAVHGVLKPGCSLTATALLATALLPEPLRAPHRDRIARAFAFLFARTDADGAVGLGGDGGIDYPTYTSAHLLHALALLRPDGAGERIAQQVARLRLVQLDAGEGWSEDDAVFGAFGFGTRPEPKPLGAGLADIALQTAVLEALRAAGVPADDEAVQRARRFVARCQRLRTDADPGGDGGFVFAVEPPWRVSKACLGNGAADEEHGASYGTTTADGIRALLACGATTDDPALVAARAWLGVNLRFDRVPGLPHDAAPPVEPALRVYWFAALARTLRALERASDAPRERPREAPLDVLLDVPPDWRERVCAALLPLQREGGSFVGLADLMKEDDPLVATPLALFALAAVLDAPPAREPNAAR